jgi:hypothetical protein
VRAGRLWGGVLMASVLMSSAPAFADQDRITRGEQLDRLPYWPGYWVGESVAGTPISGIALRPPADGSEPPDSPAIWSNRAPWNEEGKRRVAEVQRTQGPDGRDPPSADDLWPTVTGNSIGLWEGDTLVIDTIMVTNPNAFFQGGVPLSEEAHYRERIRLDGDTLRIEMTIEDPVTLSAPWKLDLGLVRDEGFDRMIQVDWNNDRTGTEGDTNTIEPPAD